MGIKIIAPDINKSDKYFSVLDDKTITIGLAAVKGVGSKAVDNIMETRKEHPFVSFADFLYRTKSSIVKKNVIQALAKAGCFDSLGISRKSAFEHFATIRTKANKYVEKNIISGTDVWDLIKEIPINIDGFDSEWNKVEILTGEGETLGDYISGSVNDLFNGFFTNAGTPLKRIKQLAENTSIRVEAVLDNITEQKTKSGKNKGSVYASCNITDKNDDSATLKIWSNMWKGIKSKLITGRPIRAMCKVNVYKGNYMLVLSSLEQVG